ncbi:phosphatase PAP2 family protein [Mycoplasma yeatsii]|uniref:Membrane-associated phospholipid phosphatase n=1 Tax=Mycoplasma yeatsii TaxID=51365 RepID=A0ABU0NE72_9MOLU|nr:phosphatase PAP2 family protein [Mycoplasma yeatsii]MDQ0567745.1 membrane-associated phospholipid phosphatase [Mycoplasma yeatsii]
MKSYKEVQKLSEFELKQIKDKYLKMITIIVLTLHLLALIALIFSTPWKWDFALLEFFSKGLDYEVVKWWSRTYELAGDSEVAIFYVCSWMIILESIFKWLVQRSENNIFKKHKYVIKLVYLIVLSTWVVWVVRTINNQFKFVNDFERHWDIVFWDKIHYRQILNVIIPINQTIILAICFYWIHFKLARREEFLTNRYWLGAIKVIVLGLITSVVILIKGLTSRPFYINVVFGDLLKQLDNDQQKHIIDYYKDQTHYRYGFLDQSANSINQYISNAFGEFKEWPWYRFNGFFNPSIHTNQFNTIHSWAFPSGHTSATIMGGFAIFTLFKHDKYITLKKIIASFIYLLHLLSMSFALVVTRGHWVSDVAFSYVLVILILIIGEKVFNKINYWIDIKFSNKVITDN